MWSDARMSHKHLHKYTGTDLHPTNRDHTFLKIYRVPQTIWSQYQGAGKRREAVSEPNNVKKLSSPLHPRRGIQSAQPRYRCISTHAFDISFSTLQHEKIQQGPQSNAREAAYSHPCPLTAEMSLRKNTAAMIGNHHDACDPKGGNFVVTTEGLVDCWHQPDPANEDSALQ